MKFLGLAAVLCALFASGCTVVAPYQRGYLARPDMAFDADPGTMKSIEKTFAAKEAASGGAAVGGGGCGCN
jgi:ribosomal protein L9